MYSKLEGTKEKRGRKPSWRLVFLRRYETEGWAEAWGWLVGGGEAKPQAEPRWLAHVAIDIFWL